MVKEDKGLIECFVDDNGKTINEAIQKGLVKDDDGLIDIVETGLVEGDKGLVDYVKDFVEQYEPVTIENEYRTQSQLRLS